MVAGQNAHGHFVFLTPCVFYVPAIEYECFEVGGVKRFTVDIKRTTRDLRAGAAVSRKSVAGVIAGSRMGRTFGRLFCLEGGICLKTNKWIKGLLRGYRSRPVFCLLKY